MHPRDHAGTRPSGRAIIVEPTGELLTYGELEQRSNQGAHLFRGLGLGAGDAIAFMLENDARFHEIVWAAHRCGLVYTCLSTKLAAEEAEYIIRDCGAKLLVGSGSLAPIVSAATKALPDLPLLFTNSWDGKVRSFERERDAMPVDRIEDESAGSSMLYSSGTTGRPKGVRKILAPGTPIDVIGDGLAKTIADSYGFSSESVYLAPAPLYHAAPLGYSMAAHCLGAEVVVMERFDAEQALRLIERHRVTHAQFVPTHFIRMLKLSPEVRASYDISSLRAVVHAAAPCPVPVKEAMLDWWGPIIYEYYGGTEGVGATQISPHEWLAKKGSVGRPRAGKVWICDDDGTPLPIGEEGMVYFEGGAPFQYHNDPEKTAQVTNKNGWRTLGDVGRVDEDGYLFLTDRKNFMIISGGVNIYPQEIENLLVTHSKVVDVAVVGAPNDEMGEEVVAVVQPVAWSDAGDALAAELIAFARQHLSHVKTPTRIDFMVELPRHDTGKIYKRFIRDAYWNSASARAGMKDFGSATELRSG